MLSKQPAGDVTCGVGVMLESHREDDILAQIVKILESQTFSRAQRLSRFLRYVVEQAIRGEGMLIKEYTLAIQVFDKDASFDPRLDPIVRVEAARLRTKLKAYYRTEGAGDSILIEIPKGTYAPVFRQRQPHKGGRKPCLETEGAEKTISVLPLVDCSVERDHEFFCYGLVQELIGALMKVPSLRVIACSAVPRPPPQDVCEIGRRLNVSTVLEGCVRSEGDRLRIHVRLVRVADGCYLWSGSFDREMRELFATQEEISTAVMLALRPELSARLDTDGIIQRYTSDPEVYKLYLKGCYHASKRTGQALKKGIEYFNRVIAREPRHAPAYAGIADCHSLLGWYGYLPPKDVMPQARDMAQKALKLDHSLADARMSLALVEELYNWNRAEAEREFRLAMELNPGGATIRLEYALFLARLGRLDEAVVQMRQAQELDPLSVVATTNLGVVHYLRQEYDQALELYHEALELDRTYYPVHFRLGLLYLQVAATGEAITSFKEAFALSNQSPLLLGLIGHGLGLLGRRADAREVLAKLQGLAAERYVTPVAMAVVAAGLGDEDSTSRWLRIARDERDCRVVDLGIDPLYSGVRRKPWFVAILKSTGFPQRSE